MGSFIDDFIETFDDSRFPRDFLKTYELLECFSDNDLGETLLVKERQTGGYYVAKCYTTKSLLSTVTESDLLSNLHHAGLPEFIGEYRNEHMICVVRTYAQGIPLDRLVSETQLSMQCRINIIVQLCEILSHMHSQNPPIIHRDIKPQNIIVDERGKVTLIDFGISREYKEESSSDTLCMGTRFYAAPEQYGFAQSDGRTDIYSLGVLLCWLASGKVEVEQGKKVISSRRLRGVIDKCTAFAPKDRYRDVNQVRDALTGKGLRRGVLAVFAAILLLTAVFLHLGNPGQKQIQQPVGITFKEPLIEEAVRLTLEKSQDEAITEQDLLSISKLFVFGDQAAGDIEDFNRYADDFVNNGGQSVRGGINSLVDLQKLPNLRSVSLVYQNISDLTPLAKMEILENVDLRHNPVEDVSPLSGVSTLQTLSLFGTRVSDLTSLHTCPQLSVVDIGDTLVESTAALDGLAAMQVLVIRKAPLRSLENIETHPLLKEIYLSNTLVDDLSPLLKLPQLQRVEISENMRSIADPIISQAQFSIIIE